ncbi:MAG: hypothetical protein ACRD1R_20990 [Acidobacteriota bacterium]
MKIAVLNPSRGLVFAEAMQSWREALAGIEHLCFTTWNQPIPDAFNVLVERFLGTDADYAWFLEEDVMVPPRALQALLDLDADIAAINYPLKKGLNRLSEWRYRGELQWVGLGCTLVRRSVFTALPRPWFRNDCAIAIVHPGSSCQEKFLEMVDRNSGQYGGQDAFFCWQARQRGFSIGVVPHMFCRHLILDQLGQPESNQGCHAIRQAQ